MLINLDPPPYQIVNHNGCAPLLIACDHADNRIPVNLSRLGLSDDQLGQHIAYDIGAKQVAMRLSKALNAPLIVAGYSRLVIDLNRHLTDPSSIPEVSDNIVIPGNQGLSESDINQRIDQIFNPYHEKYTELVSELKNKANSPTIVSVHSFTPHFNGVSRPWDFGVLWDDYHQSIATRLLRSLINIPGIEVGDNQPYHAKDPQGYAQVVHAEQNDVPMALIEIRQDLIDHEAGQKWAAQILTTVLKESLHI